MKKLVQMILNYLLENKQIPEELIYELSKTTVKIVENHCMEMIPQEFWELDSFVEAYWRAESYTKSNDMAFVYQMVQLFSFTNMLSTLAEKQEKENSIEDYAIQLKDKYAIFQQIDRNPGITHKELAQRAGMSVSSLSQFLNRYKEHGFIQRRSMGREKHYYLTAYGERLYSAMNVNRKNQSYSCTLKIIHKMDNIFSAFHEVACYSLGNEEQNLITDHLGSSGRQNMDSFPFASSKSNYVAEGKRVDFLWNRLQDYDRNKVNGDTYGVGYKEEHIWKNKGNLNKQAIV